MKKEFLNARFWLFLTLIAVAIPAIAQDRTRVEVFGGYSYLDYYVYPAYIGPWTSVSFNGWETSGAFAILPHLSAEADIASESSGNYPKLWTYMGGPRIGASFGRATIFGHVLFGALRASSAFEGNTTFAAAFGGGADVWFSRHIGVRLGQFDYIHTSFNEGSYFVVKSTHGNYRFSTGVVVRF
jgi:hypothetical protein